MLFAYFSWSDTYYLIGVWLDEDQRTNTIKTHVLKRLHYVLNFYELLHTQVGNTIRENLCIQLRNQQTCNFENYYDIRRGPDFNPNFFGCFFMDLLMVNKFCSVKSYQKKLKSMKKNWVMPTQLTTPFKPSLPLLTCRLVSAHTRNFCSWIKRIIQHQFDSKM